MSSAFATFVTAVHVFVCVFLILVILLQAGKDAGMGGAFGGGGSGTVFGGRGAGSFLGQVTAVCASIFFITSLILSYQHSVTTSARRSPESSAPATPGETAPTSPSTAPGPEVPPPEAPGK